MSKIRNAFLLVLMLICSADFGYTQVKVISVPQQGPDTRLLKNNYLNWEKTLPFNGLSIGFNPNAINNASSSGFFGRGKGELCFSVFNNNNKINYQDYTNAIKDLTGCNFHQFTNNFMMLSVFNVNWNPWDGDEAWNRMISNLSIAAKIARDSGLKGVILDTETYGSPQNLNLLFYCQQFVNKLYVKDSKIAYIRINNIEDSNSIDDLFPKKTDVIYWKDASDVANNLKLTKVSFNVYKDKSGNFYYPLIDPKFRNDVIAILSKVELRGQQIISAINSSFPDAEVMVTIGPSYVRNVLSSIYGLNNSSNYLRTGYGLLIPFTKGLLQGIENTNIRLIDGQEQTYYFKTKEQFVNAQKDFIAAGQYFANTIKAKYLRNMKQGLGLYLRPNNSNNQGNNRLFTSDETKNAFRYASSLPGIKYIWLYEEKESYWFIPSLKDKYLNHKSGMSRIGGDNFDQQLKNIKLGIQ